MAVSPLMTSSEPAGTLTPPTTRPSGATSRSMSLLETPGRAMRGGTSVPAGVYSKIWALNAGYTSTLPDAGSKAIDTSWPSPGLKLPSSGGVGAATPSRPPVSARRPPAAIEDSPASASFPDWSRKAAPVPSRVSAAASVEMEAPVTLSGALRRYSPAASVPAARFTRLLTNRPWRTSIKPWLSTLACSVRGPPAPTDDRISPWFTSTATAPLAPRSCAVNPPLIDVSSSSPRLSTGPVTSSVAVPNVPSPCSCSVLPATVVRPPVSWLNPRARRNPAFVTRPVTLELPTSNVAPAALVTSVWIVSLWAISVPAFRSFPGPCTVELPGERQPARPRRDHEVLRQLHRPRVDVQRPRTAQRRRLQHRRPVRDRQPAVENGRPAGEVGGPAPLVDLQPLVDLDQPLVVHARHQRPRPARSHRRPDLPVVHQHRHRTARPPQLRREPPVDRRQLQQPQVVHRPRHVQRRRPERPVPLQLQRAARPPWSAAGQLAEPPRAQEPRVRHPPRHAGAARLERRPRRVGDLGLDRVALGDQRPRVQELPGPCTVELPETPAGSSPPGSRSPPSAAPSPS